MELGLVFCVAQFAFTGAATAGPVVDRGTACLQGFHDRQLQEQIKLMQQHHNETEALTTMVLDQEVDVLQEAANAAVSQDIQHFKTYCIPQIQQLLSAKETLTSCWNVLPVDESPCQE